MPHHAPLCPIVPHCPSFDYAHDDKIFWIFRFRSAGVTSEKAGFWLDLLGGKDGVILIFVYCRCFDFGREVLIFSFFGPPSSALQPSLN